MKFNIIGKNENNIDKTLLRKFHKRNWFKIFASTDCITASQHRAINLILCKQMFKSSIMELLNEDINDLKNSIKEYKKFEIMFEI